MEIRLTKGSSEAVILSQGAQLRSYKANGDELMWRADPVFWGKTSPLLFPMIGNLRNGRTMINGREYEITKHGFARDNEFTADKLSENSASFVLVSNEETKKHFPFDFKLELIYTLTETELKIQYNVTNCSDTDMPYCIGAHPAFSCPAGEEDGEFSDHKLVFAKNETVSSPVMNLETRMWGDNDRVKRLENSREFRLRYSLFDNDCVYFDTISSKNVSLVSEKSGREINVSWEGFETLGVWTPDHKNAPFVCIEPWCGCDDYDTDSGVFNEKRGIQTAKPSETKAYSLTIKKISG